MYVHTSMDISTCISLVFCRFMVILGHIGMDTGPDDAPAWEMCDFLHGHGFLLYSLEPQNNVERVTWHILCCYQACFCSYYYSWNWHPSVLKTVHTSKGHIPASHLLNIPQPKYARVSRFVSIFSWNRLNMEIFLWKRSILHWSRIICLCWKKKK